MSSLRYVPPVMEDPEPATIWPKPIGCVDEIVTPRPVRPASRIKPTYFADTTLEAVNGDAGSMTPTYDGASALRTPRLFPGALVFQKESRRTENKCSRLQGCRRDGTNVGRRRDRGDAIRNFTGSVEISEVRLRHRRGRPWLDRNSYARSSQSVWQDVLDLVAEGPS